MGPNEDEINGFVDTISSGQILTVSGICQVIIGITPINTC